MAKRTFSKSELEEILRLAAIDQGKSSLNTYSREDLNIIAAEVGIDATSIDRVLSQNESHTRVRSKEHLVLGTSVWLRNEYLINNEVDSSAWHDFMNDLEREFNTSGSTSARSNGYFWKGVAARTNLEVSIRRHTNKSLVSISADQRQILFLGWLTGFAASFVAGVGLGNFFGSHQLPCKIGYFVAPILGFFVTRWFFQLREHLYFQRSGRAIDQLRASVSGHDEPDRIASQQTSPNIDLSRRELV